MDKEKKTKSKLNGLLWVVIIVLIVAGVLANYHFSETVWALRLVGWLVLACLVLGIASQTVEGKKFWLFAKDARIELRKVVWPTKDETVKTTMVIAALVIVMAVIMWGLDSFLLWAIGWLTGQRG